MSNTGHKQRRNALNGKMFKDGLLPISGRYGEAQTTHSQSCTE